MRKNRGNSRERKVKHLQGRNFAHARFKVVVMKERQVSQAFEDKKSRCDVVDDHQHFRCCNRRRLVKLRHVCIQHVGLLQLGEGLSGQWSRGRGRIDAHAEETVSD